MATALKDARIRLDDPGLFREQCYVGGAWVDAASRKTITVTDPATGEVVGTVPSLGTEEVRRAIDAAEAALPAWRGKVAKERAAVLRKWFELITESQDDLAYLMTREQGKPLAESKGEVAYGASFIEWFAEEAKRIYGDVIPQTVGTRRLLVVKQPVGVCAAITPWNFPIAMITRKAGPALAAGCTMVVKPASATPFSALALAELAERAGVPKGVFSVVTGSASGIGTELCTNKKVRKVSFTGSTEVGKILLKQCADTVKRVSMELGGLAPFIVFDDADLDKAVEGAIACKFRNAGQTCVCTNRFYVHASLHDAFVQKLAAGAAQIRVGNGFESGIGIGPLIDSQAVEKVQDHVADALARGAKLEGGGRAHALGGLFYEPTVLSNVSAGMKIMREETFGPVAAVVKFTSEEEAIAAANDTDFGLAAYFYARDIGRVWRVAEKLEYGMVGINTGIISNEVAPFGGVKQSGLGREGSKYGMDEYLEIKYLALGGIGT